MEISALDKKNFIKIKGKHTSFVVGPKEYDGPKINADALFFSRRHNWLKPSKIDGLRFVIESQGEYEIGGIKITTSFYNGMLSHAVRMDGVDVCILPSELLDLREKLGECQILVVNVSTPIDEAKLASYAPKEVVLYGENLSKSTTTDLGLDTLTPVTKLQIQAEKLPDEMQIVIFG